MSKRRGRLRKSLYGEPIKTLKNVVNKINKKTQTYAATQGFNLSLADMTNSMRSFQNALREEAVSSSRLMRNIERSSGTISGRLSRGNAQSNSIPSGRTPVQDAVPVRVSGLNVGPINFIGMDYSLIEQQIMSRMSDEMNEHIAEIVVSDNTSHDNAVATTLDELIQLDAETRRSKLIDEITERRLQPYLAAALHYYIGVKETGAMDNFEADYDPRRKQFRIMLKMNEADVLDQRGIQETLTSVSLHDQNARSLLQEMVKALEGGIEGSRRLVKLRTAAKALLNAPVVVDPPKNEVIERIQAEQNQTKVVGKRRLRVRKQAKSDENQA